MAGRKVCCPKCAADQVVPDLMPDDVTFPREDDDPSSRLHPAFNRDRFLFRQKLMTLSEKYVVWDDHERPILFIERPSYWLRQVLGALGTLAVFIVSFILALIVGLGLSEQVQPRWVGWVVLGILLVGSLFLTLVVLIALTPKRHIFFYADESKGEPLLRVFQDRKFQPLVATYTVVTPDGIILGRMKKNYLYDLFRKKWEVVDAQGATLLVAREDSLVRSLLRRFLGPLFGFLRTNFILVVPQAEGIEATRGEFNRKFTILDRYVLDLGPDRPRMIDRRLAVALGVLLDTGEHR